MASGDELEDLPKECRVIFTTPDGRPQHEIYLHANTSGAFAIDISNTASKKNFSFTLKGDQLIPTTNHNGTTDWYETLTPQERQDLSDIVLAYYRELSVDPDNMKTAAIGIIPNPDKRAPRALDHLIYVGFNTTHVVEPEGMDKDPENAELQAEYEFNKTDSRYNKSCAERHVVDSAIAAMRQHIVYRMNGKRPPLSKFVEFRVMGGREPDADQVGDRGVAAICPCGICTDLLAGHMTKNSQLFVHPMLDIKQLLRNGTTRLVSRPANHTAQSLDEVDVANREVWHTDIRYLNKDRKIELSDEETAIQEAGLKKLAEALVDYAPPADTPEITQQVLKNRELHRESIPELDVATNGNGELDPVALNQYVFNEFCKTLIGRVRRDFDNKNIPRSKTAIYDWLKTRINLVRVTIVRTDDGCYHQAKDSDTGSEKAFPNADSASVSDAIDSLGDGGMDRVYSCEVRPNMPNMLITFSKEGGERIYKRRTMVPGKTLQVTQLLLTDGTLGKEKSQELIDKYTCPIDERYRGQFGGVGKDAQNRHAHDQETAGAYVGILKNETLSHEWGK